jgi:hypothetical protein
VNLGSQPVEEFDFVIADADVTPSSEINARVSRRMPAGVDADEYEMNVWVVEAIAGAGSITARIRALEGPTYGPLYVSYIVSTT